MRSTRGKWVVSARVDAWEGQEGRKVFGRDYEFRVPRDHV
jgi:hypothetical protein